MMDLAMLYGFLGSAIAGAVLMLVLRHPMAWARSWCSWST